MASRETVFDQFIRAGRPLYEIDPRAKYSFRLDPGFFQEKERHNALFDYGPREKILRVLTYNLDWLVPPDIVGSVPREKMNFHVRKTVIDPLNPDIVALQDVGEDVLPHLFDASIRPEITVCKQSSRKDLNYLSAITTVLHQPNRKFSVTRRAGEQISVGKVGGAIPPCVVFNSVSSIVTEEKFTLVNVRLKEPDPFNIEALDIALARLKEATTVSKNILMVGSFGSVRQGDYTAAQWTSGDIITSRREVAKLFTDVVEIKHRFVEAFQITHDREGREDSDRSTFPKNTEFQDRGRTDFIYFGPKWDFDSFPLVGVHAFYALTAMHIPLVIDIRILSEEDKLQIKEQKRQKEELEREAKVAAEEEERLRKEQRKQEEDAAALAQKEEENRRAIEEAERKQKELEERESKIREEVRIAEEQKRQAEAAAREQEIVSRKNVQQTEQKLSTVDQQIQQLEQSKLQATEKEQEALQKTVEQSKKEREGLLLRKEEEIESQRIAKERAEEEKRIEERRKRDEEEKIRLLEEEKKEEREKQQLAEKEEADIERLKQSLEETRTRAQEAKTKSRERQTRLLALDVALRSLLQGEERERVESRLATEGKVVASPVIRFLESISSGERVAESNIPRFF